MQKTAYNTWKPSGQSLIYDSVPFLRFVQKSTLINSQYGHLVGEESVVQLHIKLNLALYFTLLEAFLYQGIEIQEDRFTVAAVHVVPHGV